MNEKDYKSLIEDIASDDCTVVYTLELKNNLKQVIEVDTDGGRIYHHESDSFEQLCKDHYLDFIIDNIEDYDYFLMDYKGLADEILKQDLSTYGQETVKYIEYVSEWYKNHKEGYPAYYYEWIGEENE